MDSSLRPLEAVTWRDRSSTTPIVEFAAAALGVALLVAAVAANQAWLDRHFLPSFFIPLRWYVLIETIVRVVVGASGVLIASTRSRLTRLMLRAPATVLHIAVAFVLAIFASELALRWIHLRPTEWLVAEEEPRRQMDSRLGWVLAASRTGRSVVAGRTIEYAIDDNGYRVRRVDEQVDRDQPAIVFVGESVMFGEGLTWDESIPAQVGTIVGVQSANLAVHGYSTDQMYLRLERELPRFRQPLAVVSIFMTELFGRNLDDDRPHLAPGLVWQPAEHASRVASLAGLLVPYRREETVDQGVRMTRDVLRAIVQLARARRATSLVMVPQFGSEDDAQRVLRERICDSDVPQLLVPLDPEWRLSWDRHPNVRAAHVIAAAIAKHLHRP